MEGAILRQMLARFACRSLSLGTAPSVSKSMNRLFWRPLHPHAPLYQPQNILSCNSVLLLHVHLLCRTTSLISQDSSCCGSIPQEHILTQAV